MMLLYIMLESYIFRKISAKFLMKTKSSAIVETYFGDGEFRKGLFSTISFSTGFQSKRCRSSLQ